MAEEQTSRFVTMDGLRGVVAIMVMLFHYTLEVGGGGILMGPLGVDIFFCLSGFVITYGYGGKLDRGMGTGAFLRARLIRLYPMYLVGLVIGLAGYAATLACGGVQQTTGLIALAAINGLLMLPTFQTFEIGFGARATDRGLFPFNPSAWSLFDELLCNALFAFFRPRGLRLAATIAFAFVLFALTAWLAGEPAGMGRLNWWAGPPRAMFSFYLGVALHDLWRAGKLNLPATPTWLPLILAVLAMVMHANVVAYVGLALFVSPACVALSLRAPTSPAARRLYARLGALSYPLYAVHQPMLGLMRLGYNKLSGAAAGAIPPFAAYVVFAVTTILFSLWLADALDAPARRWLGRVWKQRIENARPISAAATGSA